MKRLMSGVFVLTLLVGCESQPAGSKAQPNPGGGSSGTSGGRWDKVEAGVASSYAKRNAPAVQALLDQMLKAYRGAQSMEMRGTYTSSFIYLGERTKPTVREFEFLFRRPDRFRLVSHDPNDPNSPYSGWVDGATGARSTYNGSKAVQAYDPDDVYIGASGAVGPFANSIFDLVIIHRKLPDPDGAITLAKRVKDAKIAGREEVEGVMCDRIEGTVSDDPEVSIWTGTNDHLIRKFEIRFRAPFHPDESISTIVCRPVLNPPASDDAHLFKPPGAAAPGFPMPARR